MEDESKKLGVVSLTALVVGNTIGSGIFLLPSAMAQLGSLSLVSWIFTTLGSLCLAFVFSRMSVLIPKTGGPYAYAQVGLGNVLGFQTAYTYWINAWVGNAAIALAAMGYLSILLPFLANPVVACFTAIALVWLFTWINLRGVQTAGIVAVITTALKLIPILIVALLGWFFFHPEYITQSLNVTTPKVSTFNLITQGATLTLWAFLGFESGTVPAGSVKNPKRTIPIATILGMSISAVASIATSVVIMGMIPNEILQKSVSPFADAAQIIFGDWGRWLIAGGAAISCLGCLNGWVLIQGQIPMAAADDRLFWKIFAHRNKNGVPSSAMIITAALISVLLFFTLSPNLVSQYRLVVLIATMATLVTYLYTPVSELILYMKKQAPLTRTSVCVSVLAIFYSFWGIIGAGQEVQALGALLIMSSIPMYLLIFRKD